MGAGAARGLGRAVALAGALEQGRAAAVDAAGLRAGRGGEKVGSLLKTWDPSWRTETWNGCRGGACPGKSGTPLAVLALGRELLLE